MLNYWFERTSPDWASQAVNKWVNHHERTDKRKEMVSKEEARERKLA